MCGKGLSDGETADMLLTDCILDGLLQNRLVMEKMLHILPGNEIYFGVINYDALVKMLSHCHSGESRSL
jgi:hypothetical protein